MQQTAKTTKDELRPDAVIQRRGWIQQSCCSLASAIITGSSLLFEPCEAAAATSTTTKGRGLAARLAAKDPSLLSNRLFNVPPTAQIYPTFLRAGTWQVTATFAGYLFPSKKIPREKLIQNYAVPGFQKCSIAAIADIGKETPTKFDFRIDKDTGLADRPFNYASMIDAFLGYKAVASVEAGNNPNRVSIDFVDYKTINAERIELFCNARESEETTVDDDDSVFVCSEYLRQVTFGTGSDPGIPRQVVTNYAHFWTYRQVSDNEFRGNLLTAAYLDPQDPLFFDEPSKPVAVYSHQLAGIRGEG